MSKVKRRPILGTIFKATQNSPWNDLDRMGNVILMIDMYIRHRGNRSAMSALLIRWAGICGVSPVSMANIIKRDDILDSELSDMYEQQMTINTRISNTIYVSMYLGNKISLLHDNRRHMSNVRIYSEIFDILHTSYLTLYNEDRSMAENTWFKKKEVLSSIGLNFYLDSVMYPSMINTMVKSAYDLFYAKNPKKKKEIVLIDSLLLPEEKKEKFLLVDEYTRHI